MIRFGFIFKIKPELKNEYKKAHDEIWSELVIAIKECGFKNNSIFFRNDGTLFNYIEVDEKVDFDLAWEKLTGMDVNKRWQKNMEKFLYKNKESNTGPNIEILEEVFHLD